MNQTELLQYALRQANKLNDILEQIYKKFDQSDVREGVRLSALVKSSEALVEQITASLMLEKGD